jgi:mRNA interferase RelE/StbE
MKTEFKKLFLKEIVKLPDAKTKKAVAKCIEEVEAASDSSEIKNLKKLSGYTDYYRIRIGSYRIGIAIINQVVYFVTVGSRGDFYKLFP